MDTMTTPVHIQHPACDPGCCPPGECHDPYFQFELWCRAHGYADVCDSAPERTDLARLDAAIAAYGEWGKAVTA